MFFEGLDCVEVVLVVGFKPGMVSLEGVRITELVKGGFEYLGAGRWCELAGSLLERGDQLVFGYVLGCAWLVAGGIVFAVAPPDAPLVAAASVPGFRSVPSPTAPALDFRGERVAKGA